MAAAMWKTISSRNLYLHLRKRELVVLKNTFGGGKFGICSAAKSYAFHPQTRTLEAENQALCLTKTILKERLPATLCGDHLETPVHNELLNRFQQCIVQSRVCNFEGERSTKTTCAMPLVMNMMRVVWSEGKRFPGLCDMSLTYKPHVSAIWKRFEDNIQVSGNIGILLSSKQSLQPFGSADMVQGTQHQNIQSLDLIAPVFNLQKVASNSVNDTGFHDNSPYPHAHTLVVVNTEKNWSVADMCAQGLMFMFGRLVSQATNFHGNKMGEPLKHPLTTQCVITDGFRLSFIAYQLNTLDFSTDEGIKNIAWLLPGEQMYKKVLDGEKCEAQVEEFNTKCFQVFINMLTNGTQH